MGIYAASSEFSDTVTAINTLSIVGSDWTDDTDNIGVSAISDQVIGTIQVDNNDPDGYSLQFSSTNTGYLLRAGGSAALEADHIDYTIDVIDDDGTAPTYACALITTANAEQDLSLTEARTIGYADFTDSEENDHLNAAVNQRYDIKLSAAQKTQLLAGTYADTIAVTISNL